MHRKSRLNRFAKKSILVSTALLPFLHCNNSGPSLDDAIRVEPVHSGTAIWIKDNDLAPESEIALALQNKIYEGGPEVASDFASALGPLAAATIGLFNELPSIGGTRGPISNCYVKKAGDSRWYRSLRVHEDDTILIAASYMPGEAMTSVQHRGIEAKVKSTYSGQQVTAIPMLETWEFNSDAPDLVLHDPLWVSSEIVDRDGHLPSVSFLNVTYTISTGLGDPATLEVILDDSPSPTPTPTPRPTPTPTPFPGKFSNIRAGIYVGTGTKKVYINGTLSDFLSSDEAYISFEFNNSGRRVITTLNGVTKGAEIGDEYRFGEETREIVGEGSEGSLVTYTFTTDSDYFSYGDGFELFEDKNGLLRVHSESGVVGVYDEIVDGNILRQ